MLKILFIFLYVIFGPSALGAQENPADLKELVITQIYEYAEELYDRRDYEEAARAFNHLLQLNPDYAPALAYMRKLGYQPQPKIELLPAVSIDPTDPNADLKAQIVAEDNAINILNKEMAQLYFTTRVIRQ